MTTSLYKKGLVFAIIVLFIGTGVITLIGIYNNYAWMNLNIHVQITVAGFILLILGILSMILFYKQDEKTKKEDKVK